MRLIRLRDTLNLYLCGECVYCLNVYVLRRRGRDRFRDLFYTYKWIVSLIMVRLKGAFLPLSIIGIVLILSNRVVVPLIFSLARNFDRWTSDPSYDGFQFHSIVIRRGFGWATVNNSRERRGKVNYGLEWMGGVRCGFHLNLF